MQTFLIWAMTTLDHFLEQNTQIFIKLINNLLKWSFSIKFGYQNGTTTS